MSVTLFEAATGLIAKRARAEVDGERVRVRCRSYYPDDRRALAVWKPIERKKDRGGMSISDRLRAAETFDRQHRKQGERMGPLGPVALELLRVLYFTADYATGRLEPSIEWLRAKVKRSRSAVTKALARLRDHGWIEWVRRAQPIEDAEGQRGPQVEQIPNAYGLTLPDADQPAHAYVAAIRDRRKGPQPVDDADRRAADAAALVEMQDSLPLAELPHVVGRLAPAPTGRGLWAQQQAAADAAAAAETRALLASMGVTFDMHNASSLNGQNPTSQDKI